MYWRNPPNCAPVHWFPRVSAWQSKKTPIPQYPPNLSKLQRKLYVTGTWCNRNVETWNVRNGACTKQLCDIIHYKRGTAQNNPPSNKLSNVDFDLILTFFNYLLTFFDPGAALPWELSFFDFLGGGLGWSAQMARQRGRLFPNTQFCTLLLGMTALLYRAHTMGVMQPHAS